MPKSRLLQIINSIHEGKYNQADEMVEAELAELSLNNVNDIQENIYVEVSGGEMIEVELTTNDNIIEESDENIKYITEMLSNLYECDVNEDTAKSFLSGFRGQSLNEIDEYTFELDEAKRIFKVNSKGKKRVKIKCPSGQKSVGGSCKPIKGTEKIKRRKGALKAKKTKKAAGSGAKRKTAFKSAKAKKKRKAFGL